MEVSVSGVINYINDSIGGMIEIALDGNKETKIGLGLIKADIDTVNPIKIVFDKSIYNDIMNAENVHFEVALELGWKLNEGARLDLTKIISDLINGNAQDKDDPNFVPYTVPSAIDVAEQNEARYRAKIAGDIDIRGIFANGFDFNNIDTDLIIAELLKTHVIIEVRDITLTDSGTENG